MCACFGCHYKLTLVPLCLLAQTITDERESVRAMKKTMCFALFLLLHVLSWRSAGCQCERSAVPCPQSQCAGNPLCCFSMREEQEVGQVVGNVNVLSLIHNILANGSGSIALNGDSSEFLELNATTGDVRVKSRIDREAERPDTSCIGLSVDVEQSSGSEIKFVGVIVEDINDNPPVFNQVPQPFVIPEGTDFSRCIRAGGLEAVDHDTGQNARIVYTLSGLGAGLFGIQLNEDNDSCIVNVQELDREAVGDPSTTPEYHIQLTLTASDGELSSNITLSIIVTDVNDNAPTFTRSSLQNVEIRQDTMVGKVIRDLNATDVDFNNTLTFCVEDCNSNNNGLFALNFTTGEISVNSALTQGIHELTVIVKDEEGRRNTSTLIIDVLDVNDKSVINLLTRNVVIVEEELYEGVVVVRYEIVDDDSAQNQYVVQLTGPHTQNFDALYEERELGGTLFRSIGIHISHPVDQEAIVNETGGNIIELKIFINEIGPFVNFTHEETANITVLGINDNLPFITPEVYYAEEEAQMRLSDLAIRDLDSDEVNGTIDSFCVVSALGFPGESSPTDLIDEFEMVNFCNELGLIFPLLDREEYIDFVVVTLNITDGGGLSNVVNATIHLTDVNDNCPEFDMADSLLIPEDSPLGVQGSVNASDKDIGPNAEIEYGLVGLNNNFSIDPVMGTISSKIMFDSETKATYIVEIEAKNKAEYVHGMMCTSKITLMVEILDVNDNAPVWKATDTSVFSVFSDSATGHLVATIEATDADKNPTITYQIEPNTLFSIEPSTGIIRTKSDLSNSVGSYNRMVTASDGEHSTPRNITIEVTTPAAAEPLSPFIIGSTIGVCVLLVVAVLVVTFLVLFCVFIDKRRRSVKLSNHSRRSSEIDGMSSPGRGILRQIPSSTISSSSSRSNGANGTSRGVKFEKTVHKYDYEANGSDVYVTQSNIHLDSSGDESPVTPPRLPSAPHHPHYNGKLPTMDGHAHMNGVSRLPPIHEDFPFAPHNIHRSHPMQDEYSDDSDGNYEDDESTLPDNASSTNAPLPNTRHLSHMASSPHSTPPNSHLGPHLPMAPISPSHQFSRSPDRGAGLNPPSRLDEISVHSSSSDSLNAAPLPVHSHISSHEVQRLNRPPGRTGYPVHMPEGYVMPPLSSSRYGADPFCRYGGTDFGDASTYTSADLDDVLHFTDQEPGIFSLTATSSYDEESQL